MTDVIALGLFIVFCLGVCYFGALRELTAERRQHARERDLMLNQIMHLTGKTWTPPPAQEPVPEREPRSTIRSPEQYPDEDLA